MTQDKIPPAQRNSLPPPSAEQLERTVREDRRLILAVHTRLIGKIAIPAYLAFFLLDLVVASESVLSLFLFIRIGTVIVAALLVLATKTKWGTRHVEVLSAAVILAAIFGIEAMCPFIGGFASTYYVGVMVTCFVVGAYLPWTLPTTVIFSSLVLIGYFAFNLSMGPQFRIHDIVEPTFFLGGICFFLCFSALANDKKLRRDVSMRLQLERANRDLQDVADAKSRFFANVSHELRTPLTLILGPLEEMLRRTAAGEERETFMTMIGNGRRLLRQVNALLDIAKNEAGQLHLEAASANLGAQAQGLVDLARSHAQTKSISLETVGLTDLPDTQFDPEKVEIIIANLLSNALKFTPSGGTIAVRGRFADSRVTLEVEDCGPGVPLELRERIFERFYQIEGTERRTAEGTGVGLSLSRELARLHGGEIFCEGAPTGGSVFRLTIPDAVPSREDRRKKYRRREDQLAATRLETVAAQVLTQQQRAATLLADFPREGDDSAQRFEIKGPEGAPLLLVVEDNPDLSRFIAKSLVDEYRILRAADGVEGLELAMRHHPQVVVSDVMMPRKDGYSLCRELREAQKNQPVIILVTARTGVEAVVEGLDVGADDYVAKPFQVQELKARIAAHLRSRSLEQHIGERESRLIAIGSMTSAIIHDLRNPLSVVICLRQLALERVKDQNQKENSDLQEDLEEIGVAATRIQSMLEELLEFTRTGTQTVRLSPTDVRAFLERFIEKQRLLLSERDIELLVELDLPMPCIVEFDPPRLERVFENLVNNSRDVLMSAVDSGIRTIRLTARQEDTRLFVEISDNGPGIPKDILGTLFEPFATRGKIGGTGLGLATARNWVVAHKGRIEARANGRDGGASFAVNLPMGGQTAQSVLSQRKSLSPLELATKISA